jgi:hypothetical protein
MAYKAFVRVFGIGLFGFSSLFATSSAWAWGQIGHRTVAEVADHYLLPEVKIEISKILQGQSMESVANWPDQIRSDPAWKHTASYHFQDIPDGQSLMDLISSQTPEEQRKGGVVEAILQGEQDFLSTNNPTDQNNDLRFIIHFIGDIHQPLHAGRPEDLGGNQIPIRWNGLRTNLHAVWDSVMIEDGHKDIFAGNAKKEEIPYASFLLKKYGGEQVDQSTLNDVGAWVAEDQVPRQDIYGYKNLPADQYTAKFLSVADHRIYLAGVRLANFLNEMILKKQTPQQRLDLAAAIERITGPLAQLISLRQDNGSGQAGNYWSSSHISLAPSYQN